MRFGESLSRCFFLNSCHKEIFCHGYVNLVSFLLDGHVRASHLFHGFLLSIQAKATGRRMGHLDRHKVASIAQMLLEFSDDEAAFADGILKAMQEPTPESIAKLVSVERHKRRERGTLFGTSPELFSDPAWDILLELFEAQLTCRKLSASSIGLDSGIPQSTSLRWISLLEKLGLCSRRQDPNDRRRYWVRLTNKATTALEMHFSK